MTFQEIFHNLVMGSPIKRKDWRGYWKYDLKTKEVMIHTKEGQILPMSNTVDILFTLAQTVSNDWEIANSSNCDVEIIKG